MVQEISNEAWQAEARAGETKTFSREVRHITCRKFTPEEKIRIRLQALGRHLVVG